MFRFIVHKVGLLKHVPFFALWFDASAMIWNSLFAPDITRTIEKIEEEVSGWDGVSTSLHKFGGIQFNYAGKELGHIHSHGILDVLFSRQIKQTLIAGGRAEEHHFLKKSGWTSYYIRSAADRENALYLLSLSYRKAAGQSPTEVSSLQYPGAAIRGRSAMGLFGLASFTMEQSRKAVAVRKVLGASVANIVVMMSKSFLKLVLLGMVLAAPLAYFAATRWLQGFAYHVSFTWAVFLYPSAVALAPIGTRAALFGGLCDN